MNAALRACQTCQALTLIVIIMKREECNMRIWILIQLLTGFTITFLGAVMMFHSEHWDIGLICIVIGCYAALRSTNRQKG